MIGQVLPKELQRLAFPLQAEGLTTVQRGCFIQSNSPIAQPDWVGRTFSKDKPGSRVNLYIKPALNCGDDSAIGANAGSIGARRRVVMKR